MKLLLISVLFCLMALAQGQYFSAPNYDLNDQNRNVLFNGFRSLGSFGQPRFQIIDPSLLNSAESPNEEAPNAGPTQNPAAVQPPTNNKRSNDLASLFNPNLMNPFSGGFPGSQFGDPYGGQPGNAIRNIRIVIDPSLLEQLQNPNQGTPNQQMPPNAKQQPNAGNPPKAKPPTPNPKNRNPPKPNANVPNPEPNNIPNGLPIRFVDLPNGYRIGILDPSLLNPALLNPAALPKQQQPPNPTTTPKAPETTTASNPQTAAADTEPAENNPTTPESSSDELPAEEPTSTPASDDNPLNQPRKAPKNPEKPMPQPKKTDPSKPTQQVASNSPKTKRMVCKEE